MRSRQPIFGLMYRLGFAPWDGHPLGEGLAKVVGELPAGRALEVGCGTGDNCIYLAKHGWTVIGVDYVDSALVKARAKASVAKVEATFVRGDVTKLDSADVGDNFDLIVDYGCLHSLKGSDLEAYARAVTAVAAPTAQLTIMAFAPGALLGVPGVTSDEVGRLFADGWQQLSSVEEITTGRRGQTPGRSYLFERRV